MAAQHFDTPKEYPGILRVAVTDDYEPLNHRGSWHSMSPEEMSHAMIFAVADAVRREPDNLELLSAWKRCMLCTTFKFKLLPTAEKRTWYALQQREDVSHHQLLVHRSCFQRCHETARLRNRLQESGPDVTPQMLFDAYNQNLVMVPGAPGTVTLSFCDSAATIAQKLLEVPEIYAVLLEADSLQGLSVGSNVFDSNSRLQVILNKTGSNVEHRIWVVEGLFYMMKTKQFDKEISVNDLKGTQRTGNKGLCDLLVYKLSLKRTLFQREASARAADILQHSKVPFLKWFENEVEPRMRTFKAWMKAQEAAPGISRGARAERRASFGGSISWRSWSSGHSGTHPSK